MKKYTSRVAATALAVGLALGCCASNPISAKAEPVSPSYAAVGSDTLQDVLNALANGTRVTGSVVRSTAAGTPIGSFDATGGPSVQTKPSGPRFGRPNGSGDGVAALSRSIDGQPYSSGTPGAPANVVITGQVDIARSSSGPKTIDAAGPLAYYPFGRDALSYAHTGTNAAFNAISKADLQKMFRCELPSVGGTPVVPVIPQAGSGSRKDFLSKIGVAEGNLGTCVKVGQEHDTSALADGSPFPANAVTPMSVAQWIAQSTGAGIDRRGPNAKLGSPTGVSPVTGTGASTAPNAAFYADQDWGRDTYLVVEFARVNPSDPKFDPKLQTLLSEAGDNLGNDGAFPSQAGAVKRKFGFLPPASQGVIRAKLA